MNASLLLICLAVIGCSTHPKNKSKTNFTSSWQDIESKIAPAAVKRIDQVAMMVIEGTLQPDYDGTAYGKIKDPFYVLEGDLVRKVAIGLLGGGDHPYIHRFFVPQRPVILLSKQGEVVAGYLYSVAHELFMPCLTEKRIDGYYITEMDVRDSDLVRDDKGIPTGAFKNGRQLIGFQQALEPYIDLYGSERN